MMLRLLEQALISDGCHIKKKSGSVLKQKKDKHKIEKEGIMMQRTSDEIVTSSNGRT